MTDKEAFSKHMAKVYLSQAIAHKLSRSWKLWLLKCAAKNRRKYIECLHRDRSPMIKIGQMDLF